MKELQREIVLQVAAGKITAEEGAARLQALDESEVLSPGETPVAVTPSTLGGPDLRHIKVVSQIGSAEIVGDPSVAYVMAEGPHRARQEGDTMVIDHAAFEDGDHFTFSRGERRVIVNGPQIQPRKLTIRMNQRRRRQPRRAGLDSLPPRSME